ncbi:MAG: PAS domain S-box protein [Methanomicrobiaceae archaeon]|nr:PAS domain S-box protein [Methanomicrobiaceae archaeon]
MVNNRDFSVFRGNGPDLEALLGSRPLSQIKDLFVTSPSVWFMVIDPEHRVLLWNEGAELMSGYSQEEAAETSNIWHLLLRDNAARRSLINDLDIRLSGRDGQEPFEIPIVTREGRERTIRWSICPLSPDGGMIGYAAMGAPVPEEEIRWQTEIFNGILQSSIDAVILLDSEGKITIWNRAAERMFGYTTDEVQGKSLQFLLSQKKPAKGKKLLHERLKTRSPGPVMVGNRLEFYAQRKDGTEFPAEISLSAVRVRDGWNEIAVLREITERRKAQEQQVLLSEIVDSSHDAIIRLDVEGRILSWNAGAEKIYGYEPDEIIGENISILMPPDRKREESAMILDKTRKKQRIRNFQTIRVTKTGDKRFIDLSVSPLKDEEGNITGSAVIGRDLTKEKRMAKTMLSYITVAALRLKNPVEMVRDNLISLLDLVDVLDPSDADIDEIMLQLELQVRNSEQIIHNLRELNQAIIGSFEEEVPESYRSFFSE